MSISPPIHLGSWIEANKEKLKPPVNNHLIHDGEFIVMIIGGPNRRTDFHVNPTEEWFYQYKGSANVSILQNGSITNYEIPEGGMFVVPANVPHNPVRKEDTIGIVIERKRPEGLLGSSYTSL